MSASGLSTSGAAGTSTPVKKGSAWISARTTERGQSVFVHLLLSQYLFPTIPAVALQTYAADPKYKKYVQQVEKCLNSFDNVHEWADCIAFLKQLLKVRCVELYQLNSARIIDIDVSVLHAVQGDPA